MNLTSLVETIGLGGGLIVALFGVWTSIRSRQRDDKQAEAKAGIEAVQQSKMVQDIAIDMQDSYVKRVQAHAEMLAEELDRTRESLRKCLAEKGVKEGEAQRTE